MIYGHRLRSQCGSRPALTIYGHCLRSLSTVTLYGHDLRSRSTVRVCAHDLRSGSKLTIYGHDLRSRSAVTTCAHARSAVTIYGRSRSALSICARDLRSRYALTIYGRGPRYLRLLSQLHVLTIYIGWERPCGIQLGVAYDLVCAHGLCSLSSIHERCDWSQHMHKTRHALINRNYR